MVRIERKLPSHFSASPGADGVMYPHDRRERLLV